MAHTDDELSQLWLRIQEIADDVHQNMNVLASTNTDLRTCMNQYELAPPSTEACLQLWYRLRMVQDGLRVTNDAVSDVDLVARRRDIDRIAAINAKPAAEPEAKTPTALPRAKRAFAFAAEAKPAKQAKTAK